MLFNSVIFITIFLPLSLLGWYGLQKLDNPIYAKIFLIGMSLWFYGYYNPSYLLVLLVSLLANYFFSFCLERCQDVRASKCFLGLGICFNVGLLFYFKYLNFFLENCNYFLHTDWRIEKIALPLGISFFTFQQLSFLVDRYKAQAPSYSFVDYACFITYFPQLVAGPIVLHNEFIPQLQDRSNRCINPDTFLDGISLFILGLGKKVLLADVFAIVVNAEYEIIGLLDAPSAWITITFFMLELYFDFSGYSDMAKGMGKMFGFLLPDNFDSPLRAVSVTDFWRRWHKTLSRFLSMYIYIPLGGNRKGTTVKCCNLMIVFVVSGLWHGANWTFVVWGLLHGAAMVFEVLFPRCRFRRGGWNRLTTFVFVTLTFGIFRCDSMHQAVQLLGKLFTGGNTGFIVGLCNTLQVPEIYVFREILERGASQLLNPFYVVCTMMFLIIGLVLVSGRKAESWMAEKGRSVSGLFVLATIFTWTLISLSKVSTFLYFNF